MKATLETAKEDFLNAYAEALHREHLMPNDSFYLMRDALNDFVKQLKKNGYELKKIRGQK